MKLNFWTGFVCVFFIVGLVGCGSGSSKNDSGSKSTSSDVSSSHFSSNTSSVSSSMISSSSNSISSNSSSSSKEEVCAVDGSTTPPLLKTRENHDGFFVPPTQEATVLSWGANTTWRYTATAPVALWSSPGFDDSSWSSAPGGFFDGIRFGDVATTPWPSGQSDLWLRTSVELTACKMEHVLFWGRWDDTMEVYINGQLASNQRGWTSGYRYVGVRSSAKSAWVVGKNSIAVHVHDTGGGKYFDLGLVRNEKMSSRIEDGYATTTAVEAFATATREFMIEQGIPSGTLAVMKGDKMVLSKSFGYSDKYFTLPMKEGAVLRLASNDKVVTLAVMQNLIDTKTFDSITQQFITRDTFVYPLLVAHGLTPPPGVTVLPDTDIYKVTIGQLLTHSSGLRELPDAPTLAAAFGITEEQITLEHNIRWMTSVSGNFAPGTKTVYCSSCFMLARYVIEVLKGDLVTHIQNVTLAPAETAGIFLAAEHLEARQENEPWYATLEVPYSRWVNLEEYRALSASAPGLVRMLRRYDLGNGERLLNPETGKWTVGSNGNGGGAFWGGMAGTTSLTLQRRWDQVNIAFVFNLSGNYDELYQKLNKIADGMNESDWGQ